MPASRGRPRSGETNAAPNSGIIHRLRATRYRRRERRRRVGFYREIIGRHNLCFDVGANVGERTELFLSVPARVVAVEPQASCQRALEEAFETRPNFELVRAALGPRPGEAELRKTPASTVLASLSPEWMEATGTSGRFGPIEWSETERVPVTTLDALIAAHGEPTFCKIDVEGFELAVLQGLSRPLRCISIEFTPEILDATEACVAQLERLGAYEYNYSLRESLEFEQKSWMRPAELIAALSPLAGKRSVYGDVYARIA